MRSTVAVVGAGHVGSAVANALVLLRVCDQVVLYDRDLALAEGEQQMLQHSAVILDQAYRSLAVDHTRAGTEKKS